MLGAWTPLAAVPAALPAPFVCGAGGPGATGGCVCRASGVSGFSSLAGLQRNCWRFCCFCRSWCVWHCWFLGSKVELLALVPLAFLVFLQLLVTLAVLAIPGCLLALVSLAVLKNLMLLVCLAVLGKLPHLVCLAVLGKLPHLVFLACVRD